ncbi:MAG: transposase [Pirellulaceae bacterium]|nr:transposase [Pirellulaceae bacterium]
MTPQCNQNVLSFHAGARRQGRAGFHGGSISSDSGGLLLSKVERITGIIRQFAACLSDCRDPSRVEHSLYELVAQRIYGLALGYEDLNDHDQLRHDPLLAVLTGKKDPEGQDRVRGRDRGKVSANNSGRYPTRPFAKMEDGGKLARMAGTRDVISRLGS